MQLILRNIMEEYVILTLDEMLDMASYTLNRLQPKYVATTQGELMSRLCEFDSQFKASIMKEITQAHAIISKHPRH